MSTDAAACCRTDRAMLPRSNRFMSPFPRVPTTTRSAFHVPAFVDDRGGSLSLVDDGAHMETVRTEQCSSGRCDGVATATTLIDDRNVRIDHERGVSRRKAHPPGRVQIDRVDDPRVGPLEQPRFPDEGDRGHRDVRTIRADEDPTSGRRPRDEVRAMRLVETSADTDPRNACSIAPWPRAPRITRSAPISSATSTMTDAAVP